METKTDKTPEERALLIAGLRANLEKMLQCHAKQKELYLKMMEAIYVDDYEKNNPHIDEVLVICFRPNKDEVLKSYEVIAKSSKDYATFAYEGNTFRRHALKKKYPELEVKRYNLKRVRENKAKSTG